MITITDEALLKAKELKGKLNKPDNYVFNIKLNTKHLNNTIY